MFTRTFLLLTIAASVILVLAIVGFALFCRYRAKSFVNTGRMTDVQTWAIRADISWVLAAIFAIAVSFFAFSNL